MAMQIKVVNSILPRAETSKANLMQTNDAVRLYSFYLETTEDPRGWKEEENNGIIRMQIDCSENIQIE